MPPSSTHSGHRRAGANLYYSGPVGRTRAKIAAALAIGLLLSLLVPGAGAAAGERAASSVVKGERGPISEFPWLTAVVYEGPVDEFACSATVVAPRLVLTAGHCAVSEAGRVLDPDNFHAIWATANLKRAKKANTAEVTRVLVAPGFQPNNLLHDAALLVLAAPVGAPAIPLATAADAALYSKGTPITIAGWGLTGGMAEVPPASFRTGETEIGGPAYCRREADLLTPAYEPSIQLCATDARHHRVGACNGDSGGPGIARRPDGSPVQVGIISLGGPFCDLSFPEVQTRVDQLSPWVAGWVAAEEAGGPQPPVVIPPPLRLPKLTIQDARLLSLFLLLSDFGPPFLESDVKKFSCRRLEREKVKCQVLWVLPRRTFGGGVTIFLALPREGSVIDASYRIRRVRTGCWERRHSIGRCPGPILRR